ncbi:hypothetical protein TBLA_0C00460 [Henningerozyma blattae CBS 6284]|uniref:Pore and endoplasmic reticulum protein of 33 kDa n=1 Tax=Henningerozyma blattae (strain ATCC 34711 / CBS 6284 / DSM 70876 / NBRC 10599 / NRRL Y-10934 / UCD 77-7) TaxID=1071380 RepID=I2H0G0_HENB6|nr:hypothetical protein TBLA_0C00460 [Tetrapisispora blattae CBS 6284]CCH59862.1 hypothetical protein TBLA_0C00460 [Tetrapisispora blattae CBS 6284]
MATTARNDRTKPTSPRVIPFSTILRSRVKQPQFYWFLGHFFTLYHFIRFHLSFYSRDLQRYHYKFLLLNISLTYAIVLYQFYKSDQLNSKNIRTQLRKLDNLQYFLILTILFIISFFFNIVLSGAIYSPVIFSLFHCLNYFKENLLPFLPYLSKIVKITINNKISGFISSYNEIFLQMAQTLEILCGLRCGLINLPILILKFFTIEFGSPIVLIHIFTVFSYVWFFKLRLIQSQHFKTVLFHLNNKFNQMIPASALPFWCMYRDFMIKCFNYIPI